MVLDKNIKAFIIYVNFFSLRSEITIYSIRKASIVLLIFQKTIVLVKYLDYANVFSRKSTKVLPKKTSINKYDIKLLDSK